MKYNWSLLLVGAFFFTLLTSMKMPTLQPDSSDLKVEIKTVDDLRVQLTAQNETGKKLYLSVLKQESDAFRVIAETEIYAEEVSGDVTTFNRTLNLSQLESGTYRIKIKAGKRSIDRLLNIRAKPATEETRAVVLQ